MTPAIPLAESRRLSRGEWALVGLVALAVSVAFALPQVLYLVDGNRHAVILRMDEAPYVARVREVLDGYWRPVDQYIWEHKANPPVLPWATEMVLGLATLVAGADVDAMLITVRFVAPAMVTVLLFAFLRLLTESAGWAIAGTALILLEPGSYFVKPFAYATRLLLERPGPDEMALFYTRFHNPLVLIIPFLVAVVAVYRVAVEPTRGRVAAAGVALGLNVYSQVFYWAYLYGGLSFLTLAHARDARRRNAMIAMGVIGLVVGGFAIAEQLIASATTPRGDLLPRIGVMLRTHEPLYLLPKAFLAVALLFATLFPRRDPRYVFLLSFMAAGYVLLNQNVVTGREIQNYHFNYANAVIAMSALVVLVQAGVAALARRVPAAPWPRIGLVALAVLLVWLTANALGLQARSYAGHARTDSLRDGAYPSNLKRHFTRTLEWISRNTPIDSVFLAEPALALLIPVYTHGNVFLDPLQEDHGITMISEDELFERWVVYMKLQGLDAGGVFERVRYREPMTIPGWPYGRNAPLRARHDISEARAFSEILRSDRLARDYADEFARVADDRVVPALARYRLDYVLVSEQDSAFRRHVTERLGARLTRVAAIPEERVEVFRFERAEARR